MKKTSLAQFINKKLGKVFFVSLMSLFLLGVLFIVSIYFESYEIRKEDFSTAVKYINLKTDMVINSTEKIYNTQIENVFSEIQDKYDSSDENSFEKYLKDSEINILNIKDVKIPAKSVNYYVINENGIIYKTDFETDLGLDLKPYSQFWEELKNMKPGESKFYPITEEVNTGKLRIYSYLKMNNGEILEIGVSVDDITDFYNEVVNDINQGFEDLEIYSKYYKPLLNSSSSLTETEKEFFRESIRDKKIIIKNKTPLRAVFYMASKSEYGNKYFKVTFLNSRFGIIFIFYFIIILLMFLIINFIKKRMKNNLVEIIEPIVNISGDMENFAENKESTFKAETTNIKEIDMIADNYLKMSQEINASFEELKAINEELNDSYRENTALISKIDKITDIIINLKRYRSTENFLSTVFRYITDFVPEVDYGLVTRIYDGKVNFIDGIGYDTEALNKIDIPEESYIMRKNIEVIEINDKNIESIDESKLEEDKYKKLLKLMKPVKKTLYIPVITDKKFYGGITLQIAKDSEKNFTADIYKFSNYFSRLINLYLSVKEYGDDIRNSYRNFSSKLAMVAEAHDNETGKHIYRVGALSEFIACKMGFSKNFVKEIKDYAPLHDIGKIYVPIDILRKNGRLTSEEWDIMKKHTIFAERLLGDDVYFKTALNIAMYHHEKYDGSGYPFGMKGDEIPIEAQIVAIIDVYDALRSDRPYKAAITHEKTIEIILSSDERTNINHFNPKIVKIFEENQNEIRMLWEKINLE